jgi:phosphodiesterase/alkaline phosphatase D-like protein
MMRARRLTMTGLVTLGVLAGGSLAVSAPAFAAAPTVVSQSVPSITPYEARLEATVNAGEQPAGRTTECNFEYGAGSISEHKVPCEQGTPPGTLEGGEQGVSLNVTVPVPGTPLVPSTPYHYRVVVKNATGKAEGTSKEFTTLTLVKPEIGSESASAKDSEATLNAQVNPKYQETSCEFEYGTDASLATHTTVKCAPEFLGNGGGGVGASVTVKGLNADETYYYRVLATNATGTTTDPTIETFTTVPVPFTDAVTSIGKTTATLNGHVTLNPSNTTVTTQFSFDYNPSATECVNGPTIATGAAGPGSGLVSTAQEVTELQPNATYSVCLATSNTYGSEVDPKTPLVTFKTLPAPPTIELGSEKTSEPTSSGSTSGAKLEAQVNPNNEKTKYTFEYSTTEASGVLTGTIVKVNGASELAAEFGNQLASVVLTGLEPDTTYYYRVVAENAQSETEPKPAEGAVQPFTTQAASPLVSTGAFSALGQSSVNVTGTVNPEGAETYYYYQYGTTTEYGQSTSPSEPGIDVGAGTGTVQAPASLLPLVPGVTYHYRLVAWNIDGTGYGQDKTFTTEAGLTPLASTDAASGISVDEATLSGTVNPQGKETSYRFEYGEGTEYGTQVFGTILAGQGVETVTLNLRGIDPDTTYHYRLVASNAGGTAYGEDMTFTTPGILDPLVNPATAPLIANPAIAFPTGRGANTGTTTKTLTKAEKLTAALKVCRKEKSKSKRATCEKQAHKKYPAAKAKKRKK